MTRTLILLFTMITSLAVAQEEKQVYTVNPGEDVNTALPRDALFAYPQYKLGQVYFRNGRQGTGNMNYNRLFGEIMFINGHDTMALGNEEDIRLVAIEKDTFYFQKIWVKQISASNDVKLAESRTIVFANSEKIGAFGQTSSGSSIDAVENIVTPTMIKKSMQLNQKLTFRSQVIYYFSDRHGNFKQMTRKNLVNIFGNKYPKLDKFLADGKFNYQDKSDVEKVFAYLTTS